MGVEASECRLLSLSTQSRRRSEMNKRAPQSSSATQVRKHMKLEIEMEWLVSLALSFELKAKNKHR